MMRLFSIFKIALLILCCVPSGTRAQIALVEDQALSFGQFSFLSFYDPIQITVDTAGNVTNNANTVILVSPQRGEYTITGGTPNAAYTITTSASSTIANGPTGTFTMDNITVSPAASNFDGFGETNILVGARLQSAGGGTQYSNGTYSGTADITISY